jgi:UDP-glucose-4-epimerase GalE
MTTLVTGGAGYIGSHTSRLLAEHGESILILDDFSEGHRPATRGLPVVEGSLADREFVQSVFARHRIEAVMHFAAACYVGESVRDPAKYYRQNVVAMLNLLEAMGAARVPAFVFSSSCAVYGEPARMPITEDTAKDPVNPYGRTKLVGEGLLRDFAGANGLRSLSLRYFNAAGAHPDGTMGEHHDPETHLIPLALLATMGKAPPLTVFGDDYPTPDGTCVRDYIHIQDLAEAHRLALVKLRLGPAPVPAVNLGTGRGHSIREVLAEATRVTGRDVPHSIGARRPGDPPVLVAGAGLARDVLGWEPRYAELGTILETAWRWTSARPDGYAGAGTR